MPSCLRFLPLLALCSLAAVLVGCFDDCTAVDCAWGRGTAQLVLSLEEHGEPFNRSPFSGTLTLVEVHAALATDDGRRIDATRAIDYETSHPNGPECGTGCRAAIVQLAFE